MPVLVPPHLRFVSDDYRVPLDADAIADLLALARQIESPNDDYAKYEVFKRHFTVASGRRYMSSSNLKFGESDFELEAGIAAEHAPNFIAAFWGACEALKSQGAEIPTIDHVNRILALHEVPYHITDGELVERTRRLDVAAPEVELNPRDSVSQAVADASLLIASGRASSAIDRLHTALHGYLRQIALDHRINLPEDVATSRIFRVLREQHPAFLLADHRKEDVGRVLQSMASVIDSLSTIRNKASLAHANQLLDEPEAAAIVNATRTVFWYASDCLYRYSHRSEV